MRSEGVVKKVIFFVSLLFLASSAHAEHSILGKWKDKNEPLRQFEFKKNQDFISTRTYRNGVSTVQEGVWEIGTWTVTRSNGAKRECNLSIYLGDNQCCFEYKFIADNLILTNIHKLGYGDICNNRVLIRETKDGTETK